MSAREIKVTCPCCESHLDVDVRSGQILKWRRATELDETGKPKLRESDWDDAADKVDGRLSTASDKFDAGMSREQNREQDLDDLFRKAAKKIDDRKDKEL